MDKNGVVATPNEDELQAFINTSIYSENGQSMDRSQIYTKTIEDIKSLISTAFSGKNVVIQNEGESPDGDVVEASDKKLVFVVLTTPTNSKSTEKSIRK